MGFAFKIWTSSREIRSSIFIDDTDNFVDKLLTEGSKKLGIEASSIVLENDGTVIDDDKVLQYYRNEYFILLQDGEKWEERTVNGMQVPYGHTESLDEPTELINSSNAANQLLPSNELPVVDLTESTTANASSSTLDNSNVTNNEDDDIDLSSELQSATETSDPVGLESSAAKISLDEFEIPWDKFEPAVLRDLELGSKANNLLIKCLNRVVDELRYLYGNQLYKRELRKVVLKMTARFPKTFEDKKADGTKLGDGCATVLGKMIQRNNNLNRSKSVKSLHKSLHIPLQKQKLFESIKNGCKDWQPEKLPEKETERSLEQMRLNLADIANNIVRADQSTIQECVRMLKLTYISQRKFLNNFEKFPTLQDIKENWPILLKKHCLLWHFTTLTDVKAEDFRNQFTQDIPVFISFGRLSKLSYIDEDTATDEEKVFEVMQIIFKKMKEDPDKLFLSCSVSTFLYNYTTRNFL